MHVKLRNGYWTIYSQGTPIAGCASLSEALKQMIECTRALRYSASPEKNDEGDLNDELKPGAQGAAGDR